MPLQLKIVSDHGDILGEDIERLFLENGGTIGRSLENDWILPDPYRYISGRHATIDYRSGAYYLADVSSNGVYINDEIKPLGKGNPRRLFNGDRLRMGDFEMLVSLDEGEDLDMPPPTPMTVVPDNIEQLVPEDPLRTGIQLLSEEALTGDDAFQSAMFGKKAGNTPEHKSEQVDKAANPFEAQAKQEALNSQELLDAFLHGLGIKRSELHPAIDPIQVMTNAGRVLNEFANGISELLVARASVKSLFRLDQTIALAHSNNPLKLPQNVKDSIKQLLVGQQGEHAASIESVEDVCRDLRFHHDALLDGMTQAFQDFAERFDPEQLQQNFDRTLKKKPLLAAMNQVRYWQLYCDLYPILTQQGSGQLPHQFGEEFVRTYEKQIAEYKRLDVCDRSQAPEKKAKVSVIQPAEDLVDQVEHGSDW